MEKKLNDIIIGIEDAMLKFGEAHDLLAKTKLTTKEYQPISTLLSDAKTILFNSYLELKIIKNQQ